MILQIDSTNAMMIHNLVSRYEWFIGLFKKWPDILMNLLS